MEFTLITKNDWPCKGKVRPQCEGDPETKIDCSECRIKLQLSHTLKQVIEWLNPKLKTGKGSLSAPSKQRTFIVEFTDKDFEALRKQAGL